MHLAGTKVNMEISVLKMEHGGCAPVDGLDLILRHSMGHGVCESGADGLYHIFTLDVARSPAGQCTVFMSTQAIPRPLLHKSIP